MKYIVLLGDGMSDYPIPELGGLTPLEASKTINMDIAVQGGISGYVKTVPDGFPPGSDVANLSALGYDPKKYYTGRAPLEAANMGVTLSENDIAFRCNLVSLKGGWDNAVMDDFSAGHITTEEASHLITALKKDLSSREIDFYLGVSYRHLTIWHGGKDKLGCTPPHDISDKPIKDFLPKGEAGEFLISLMKRSQDILKDHPVNVKRVADGKKAANTIWLWGEGKGAKLPKFKDMYGIDGGVISAVNLMNGIGALAGLKIINVPNATGYLDTNYKGKVEYAIEELKRSDFIYLHVEAPDEASHEGSLEKKLKAIDDFDALVVGEVMKKIKQFDEYRILILCDHPTPVSIKTHTSDPVPYVIYPFNAKDKPMKRYNETIVKYGMKNFDHGYKLMRFFIDGAY